MCAKLKFLYPLLLLFCLGVALRAEEQWYLISETELRSIEQYLEKSELEKLNWQSRAEKLRIRAESLETDSASLNRQLEQARETQRRLEQSFNEYEADRLTLVSSKNGEIAGLKEEIAAEKLAREKYKGQALSRLIIIIAVAVIIVLYIAFKVCRFLRLI